MNERNARAILAELIAYLEAHDYIDVSAGTIYGDSWDDELGRLARFLADRGHLAPSSLTEQDIGRFDSGCGTGEYEVEDPVSVADWIDLLERIAKGET